MDMVREFKTAMGTKLEIRIGLTTGKITAGVLGTMNPHWCVVGDTVNTASRMESTSFPMRIHIRFKVVLTVSESTYDQIIGCGRFNIDGPEILQVKGKGEMVSLVY